MTNDKQTKNEPAKAGSGKRHDKYGEKKRGKRHDRHGPKGKQTDAKN